MSKEQKRDELTEIIIKANEDWLKEYGRMHLHLEHKAEYIAAAVNNAGYRKQSEWISVEERLPELYTYVLTYDTVSGNVQIDSVLSNGEFVIGYNVTHWMPLPEAPKMKGD